MAYVSVSSYDSFLKTQLNTHVLLTENHAKMQAVLEVLLTKSWGKSVAEAYLKKLWKTLKNAERMNYKEFGYLLEHRAHVQSLAQADIRIIGYSNYCLISNGQNNIHQFLGENYLEIQGLITMMSRESVLKNKKSAQSYMEIFSKYLIVNHSMNKIVLKNLEKITFFCEKVPLTDRHSKDLSGSEQFKNLMDYCNRWGSQGS